MARRLLPLLFAVLLGAAPASAFVYRNARGQYLGVNLRAGVTPAAAGGGLHLAPSRAAALRPAGSARYDAAGSLIYQSAQGPVLHGTTFYPLFWVPPGEAYPVARQNLVARWMADTSQDSGLASNAFAVAQQYTDAGGRGEIYRVGFGGALADADPYPPPGCVDPALATQRCLTDAQIRTELTAFVHAHGLASGPGAVYFLLTPADVTLCTGTLPGSATPACSSNVFCGFHADTAGAAASGSVGGAVPADDILYALVPLLDDKACQHDGLAAKQEPNGDAVDIALKVAAHEGVEVMNNPLGNAWRDAAGAEIGDKCNGSDVDPNSLAPALGGSPDLGGGFGTLFTQSIAGHAYYLQSEWSNGEAGCRMVPAAGALEPQFTAPPLAAPGIPVAFDAAAASAANGISSFNWDFGDGGLAAGRTPSHAFAAGTHTVRLTVIDRFGRAASVQRPITIDAPPHAAFTSTPAPAGRPTAFDGSASSDPDGTVTRWSWNFGDGAAAAGSSVKHVYGHPGSYAVTLTVADNSGNTHAALARVRVAAPGRLRFRVRSARLTPHGLLLSYETNAGGRLNASVSVSGALARALGLHGATIAGAVRELAGARAGRLRLSFRRGTLGRLRRRAALPATVRLTLSRAGRRRTSARRTVLLRR
ncbi:MAG: hypothetical protein NVSMB51_17050 [Solirubrobacteraceae bacterium]